MIISTNVSPAYSPSVALYRYTTEEFTCVNSACRADGFHELIFSIDEAFGSLPTHKGITYRGMSWEGFIANRCGGHYLDRGYMSTSLSKEIAQKFGRGGVVLEVHSSVGINITSYSRYAEEEEVLIPRGIKFVIQEGEPLEDGTPYFILYESEEPFIDEGGLLRVIFNKDEYHTAVLLPYSLHIHENHEYLEVIRKVGEWSPAIPLPYKYENGGGLIIIENELQEGFLPAQDIPYYKLYPEKFVDEEDEEIFDIDYFDDDDVEEL